MYELIFMCGHLKKDLIPLAFFLLGRLRYRVINSVLQSTLTLSVRTPGETWMCQVKEGQFVLERELNREDGQQRELF